MLFDPSTIIIKNRQRRTPTDVDAMAASIARRGQLQNIRLRRDENGQTVLVVGLNRLLACQKLGRQVEGDYIDNLSEDEAELAELEENVRRTDLHWRDQVNAVGKIYERYRDRFGPGFGEEAASQLGMTRESLSRIYTVFRNIDSPLLKDATGYYQAYSILQITADRKAAAIIGNIITAGQTIFDNGEKDAKSKDTIDPNADKITNRDGLANSDNSAEVAVSQYKPRTVANNLLHDTSVHRPTPYVLCADFLKWADTYSGQKFNLIHCDFPYDVQYYGYAHSTTTATSDYDYRGFFILLEGLCRNLDRIASYQSHIIMWFTMNNYEQTRKILEQADLFVHKDPLVWFKSDNAGIIPGRDNQYPRRIYETAFLCSRGKRPLIRSLANAYAAPTVSNALHPSQKPEPVLNHFFSMLVDQTTDMLDPTCGSGSALRSAETCGARSVLGLEVDPKYAEAAEKATVIARQMRKAVGR